MFGVLATSLLNLPVAFAGVGAGGGGDATSEMRIDEIRADLLKWISEGGARGLALPPSVTYESYASGMGKVLPRHAVVIGTVTLAEEAATQDEELKVSVNGQFKTCRGFISVKDSLPHILCNTERFAATAAPKQYRLIHHEYAGLAAVEHNRGASSDYGISDQISDYLVPETVLRLSVKKPSNTQDYSGCIDSYTLSVRMINWRWNHDRELENYGNEGSVSATFFKGLLTLGVWPAVEKATYEIKLAEAKEMAGMIYESHHGGGQTIFHLYNKVKNYVPGLTYAQLVHFVDVADRYGYLCNKGLFNFNELKELIRTKVFQHDIAALEHSESK